MPILRCLFCNHVNPAEASFCNACGSQLDLQPCGQCGAVDSRKAKSCHKCGTPFAPALASELDALLAPMAPGPHGEAWDYSSRIEASVAGAKAIFPAHAQPRAVNDRQLTVGETASGRLVQPTRAGNNWLVPGVALLAVAAAAMFAIVYQRPVATAPTQAAQPLAPPVAVLPAVLTPTTPATPATPPAAPEPAAKAEPVEAASPPKDLRAKAAVVTNKPKTVPARAVPRPVATQAAPPVPVPQPPQAPRREPAAIKNCSQALATLGLCNP